MNILVTGGGGFLGSHLVERLVADGESVVVPRRSECDLTLQDDVQRLFYEAEPERYFYPDQYSNDANWQAHYNTTAPEIIEQTRTRQLRSSKGNKTSDNL